MILTLFIVLLVVFLIMVIVMDVSNICGYYFSDVYGAVTLTVGVITIISLVLVIIEEPQSPTAMDVYKGKTTLAITYEEGIPVDSTVVFKKKK